MIRRRHLREFRDTAKFLLRARLLSERHGYKTTSAFLLKTFAAYRASGLRPWPALRAGLLAAGLPDLHLESAIAKERLLQLQAGVNPSDFRMLVDDKIAFHGCCRSAQLPVPASYAAFARPAGWIQDGSPLRTEEEWEEFLLTGLPDSFVVKPANGMYGLDVQVYTRIQGGFRDAGGILRTAKEIYRQLFDNRRFSRFVFQERLESHRDLADLSGTDYLQTVRLVTYVAPDGDCDVYLAALKLIGGASAVDNYFAGAHGNLACPVTLCDGRVISGLRTGADHLTLDLLRKHPRTNRPLSGFQIPFWQEAVNLARRAAVVFLPIRTIGWDVAITPGGPVLVEGNTQWDPLNVIVSAHSPDSPESVKSRQILQLLKAAAAVSA